MRPRPFGRVIALIEAIAGIYAATTNDVASRQTLLGGLEPYRSRGKGRGPGIRFGSSRRTVACAKREACKARNRRRAKGK